jgi:hypothetical protein
MLPSSSTVLPPALIKIVRSLVEMRLSLHTTEKFSSSSDVQCHIVTQVHTTKMRDESGGEEPAEFTITSFEYLFGAAPCGNRDAQGQQDPWVARKAHESTSVGR